jgi:hypothetical protein
MKTQLAIVLAVWYASDNYRTNKVWTVPELTGYLGVLRAGHTILRGVTEDKSKSSLAHWISNKSLTVLHVRIDELENLLRLHPLVLGRLNR